MIYIWDNDGAYSDHTIYFVESALSSEEIEALLPFIGSTYSKTGHLLGIVEKVEWRNSRAESIASVLRPEQFFSDQNDPNPSNAPRIFEGGSYRDEIDIVACEQRRWDAAKYKWHFNKNDGKFARANCGNPIAERFKVLTTASAKELIDGWSSIDREQVGWLFEKQVESFKSECRERGIL